jgi:hypothetical protein
MSPLQRSAHSLKNERFWVLDAEEGQKNSFALPLGKRSKA